MTTPLTLRSVKGSPLTSTEGDDNLLALRTTADAAAVAATLAGNTGAGQVGYLAPYTGAVATTQAQANNDKISVFRWMTSAEITDIISGTATIDVTTKIQAALDALYAISLGTVADDFGVRNAGAASLWFPRGIYKTTATLETYQNIAMKGDGRYSTIIRSTVNGHILRNKMPGDQYGPSGISIEDLMIQGDRTKASQVGIALLRPYRAYFNNVTVQECGSHGVALYQAVNCQIDTLDAHKNVGSGLVLDQGFNSWSDGTLTGFPSIGNVFVNLHAGFNDGPGIVCQGITEANIFYGGSSEMNQQASAHAGYQIVVQGASLSGVPNEFNDFYSEATNGLALVHVNLNNVSNVVRFKNFHHYPQGLTGTLDRAAFVNQGTLVMDGPTGSANPYVAKASTASVAAGSFVVGIYYTINVPGTTDFTLIGAANSLAGTVFKATGAGAGTGTAFKTSIAPFRVTKVSGIVRVYNPEGCSITKDFGGGFWVEDENFLNTGLNGQNFTQAPSYKYGPNIHRSDTGDETQQWQASAEAFPWAAMENTYKSLTLSGGYADKSAIGGRLKWITNQTLGMDTGHHFQVDGLTGGTLKVANATANAAVATTLGSVGPTGSTAGNPQGWFRIKVAGTDRFIPYW